MTQERINGVEIRDLRHSDIDWVRNGIAVTRLETTLPYEDFDNEDLVKSCFLREVRDHLRKFLGTQDVHLVEFVVSASSITLRFGTSRFTTVIDTKTKSNLSNGERARKCIHTTGTRRTRW